LLALNSAINYAKVHGLEKRLAILLEEPESHIFPFLLRLLIDYIKRVSQKSIHCDIIVQPIVANSYTR
jgi:predicted ATPase